MYCGLTVHFCVHASEEAIRRSKALENDGIGTLRFVTEVSKFLFPNQASLGS